MQSALYQADTADEIIFVLLIVFYMEKKTICVDFDGVIAQYDGFKGNDIFGDPIDGVQSAMEVRKKERIHNHHFTTRTASSKLKKYLNDNHNHL